MPEKKLDALVVDRLDNTATALSGLRAGSFTEVGIPGLGTSRVLLREDIPRGHKFALREIPRGGNVIKHGEVIGRAFAPIQAGEHVHIENVESLRGRGDRASDKEALDLSGIRNDALLVGDPVLDASGLTFRGYPRPDGRAGTRNLVGIISCVACANDVVSRLGEIEGTAPFTHLQGCSQTMPDVQKVTDILVNLAGNPNLGAVLYVALGCESVSPDEVVRRAKAFGKPVELVVIQKEGGLAGALQKARPVLGRLLREIAADPVDVPFGRLKLGLKCGSSDTTQGISANVVCGRVTEIFAAAGASVVIGETTEFMGAEHIAARHAKDEKVAAAIVGKVDAMEKRALAAGVDMRGGQPTRGNILGGLTTIEEKSLGALAKAGRAVFQDVVSYGEIRDVPGLVMMDAPGREPEMLTGLAAAGCNVILFTTGRGAPQGFPFVPVVKVTGNAQTWETLREHMDACVSGVLTGEEDFDAAARRLFGELMAFCSGRRTQAEVSGYNQSMNIYVTGPTI